MLHDKTLDVTLLNDYRNVCNSCTICNVLFAVFSITSICISSVFIYFQWCLRKNSAQGYLKKNNVRIKVNPGTQTTVC